MTSSHSATHIVHLDGQGNNGQKLTDFSNHRIHPIP